jgi:putative DNA primase/helicase
MFFLGGSGANGKGVFLEVLRHVIGGYAQDASFETFIDSKNESEHRNDLAALAGARFVTASESQDGHRLDEALIKKLTGVQNFWGGGKNFIPKGIGMVAAVGLEPTTYGL